MNYKYYLVKAKFGHVGKNYYILKNVPVEAPSKKAAAQFVKHLARAKHDHKDVIRDVIEISESMYESLYEKYRNDPYFQVNNIQDEKRFCKDIDLIKIKENDDLEESYIKDKSNRIYHKAKEKVGFKEFYSEINYYYENYNESLTLA